VWDGWLIYLLHERQHSHRRTPTRCEWEIKTGDTIMLTRTVLALAFAVVAVSGALAAPKKHSPNATWDVYDGRAYLGSDPDPHIRNQLMLDRGSDF
jgi:hypothetical protein